MKDEPEAEDATLGGRYQPVELQLDLDRVGLRGESEPEGQSADMGIHR